MEVVNYNNSAMSKKSIHIGTGKVYLKSVVPKLNEPSDVVIDLTHVGGKKGDIKKGKVKMTAFIEHTPSVAPPPQISKPAADITVVPVQTVGTPVVSKIESTPPVEKKTESNFDPVKIVAVSKPISAQAVSEINQNQEPGVSPSDGTKNSAQSSTSDDKLKPVITPSSVSSSSASGTTIPAGSTLRLTLRGLLARDLKDTGSFLDPQDPALRITIQGVEQITAR